MNNTQPNSEQLARCNFLLDLSPDELDAGDIRLLEKFALEQWAQYCDAHWGAPEEQPLPL